jgi:hypothetical protein
MALPIGAGAKAENADSDRSGESALFLVLALSRTCVQQLGPRNDSFEHDVFQLLSPPNREGGSVLRPY